MRGYVFLGVVAMCLNGFSQKINAKKIEPTGDYENVSVQKIYSDSFQTSYVIWVKQAVKSHKHDHHSEAIYVQSGKGLMTVGDRTFAIKKGDYFVIPAGTIHNVVVSSRKPLKVISIQTPEFLGKDRIWIHE